MKPSENRAGMSNKAIEFWSDVYDRMGILLDLMMVCKGDYDIDDPEKPEDIDNETKI